MTTLRDALSEALGKAETGTLAAPQETNIETPAPLETPAPQDPEPQETAAEREQRLRDEKGRFTKAEQKEQPQIPQPTPAPVAARKPPSSWKKDYWQHWEKLGTDPELSKLQEYIEQREQDYAKGVSTYKQQWDQAAPVYEAIQQFAPELQRFGIQPQQWITNLGNAHRTLAMGSPEQKLQMFAKLATDYGVPLQALTQGQQADPQFTHVVQNVQTLQQKLDRLEQDRRQAEQARLLQEIEAFKQNAPHFEAVRSTVAQLLQSGLATDLKTAYEKAIRLDDNLMREEQARQAKEAEAQRLAEIAKKKAAAVSPRSSSPTGSMAAGGGKKGLREALSEAMETHSSGRF